MRRPNADAFTLIEVILAISIAMFLLLGVLVFYEHAARIRDEVETGIETTSAARLFLAHISRELQAAQSHAAAAVPLTGYPDRIEFSTTTILDDSAWSTGEVPSAVPVRPDYRRVGYRLKGELSPDDVVDAASDARRGVTTVTTLDQPVTVGNLSSADSESESIPEYPQAPTGIERSEHTPAPAAALSQLARDEVSMSVEPPPPAPSVFELTDRLLFLRFRYYDGFAWRDVWTRDHLPRGVEVRVGSEPLPEDVDFRDYPYPEFRRVIHLPAGGWLPPVMTARATVGFDPEER